MVGVLYLTLYHNLLNWFRHILINLILIQSGRNVLKDLCNSYYDTWELSKQNTFNRVFLYLEVWALLFRKSIAIIILFIIWGISYYYNVKISKSIFEKDKRGRKKDVFPFKYMTIQPRNYLCLNQHSRKQQNVQFPGQIMDMTCMPNEHSSGRGIFRSCWVKGSFLWSSIAIYSSRINTRSRNI